MISDICLYENSNELITKAWSYLKIDKPAVIPYQHRSEDRLKRNGKLDKAFHKQILKIYDRDQRLFEELRKKDLNVILLYWDLLKYKIHPRYQLEK